MRLFTITKTLILFLILLSLPPSSFAEQSNKIAAISAAENFLQLVDSGQYAESWDASSRFFKQQVSKEQWKKQLERIRPVFGNKIKREVKTHVFLTSFPGAPDGEYAVIQFSTSFTNKKNAIETITPMLEIDGEWRVTGYYIQ